MSWTSIPGTVGRRWANAATRLGSLERRWRACARTAITLLTLVLATGCRGQRPQWHDEPRSATLAYWTEQPGSVAVEGSDYRSLWKAADESRRRFDFEPAMQDYRGGVLTTDPHISPQLFEFWRHELRRASDLAESSLATIRRRLRFRFAETVDGRFVVEPQVIIERLALSERRITSAIEFRRTLGPGQQRSARPGERDATQYWYATGRDEALERSLARRIARKAGGEVVRPPPSSSPQSPAASAARE